MACIEQANYDEAHAHLTRSLAVYQQLSDAAGSAGAQFDLARIAIERAAYAEARQLLAKCQRLYAALHDERGLAGVQYRQAWLAFDARDFATGETLALQALAAQETQADTTGRILTLQLLADITLHGLTDFARAEQYCAQALAVCDETRNDSERAAVLFSMAEVHRLQGQIGLARREAKHVLQLFKQMGDRKSQARALYRLSLLEADRSEWESAKTYGTLSLDLCRQLRDGWGEVYVAHHLGQVYAQLRHIDLARALWAAALSVAAPLAHPLTEALRELVNQ